MQLFQQMIVSLSLAALRLVRQLVYQPLRNTRMETGKELVTWLEGDIVRVQSPQGLPQ